MTVTITPSGNGLGADISGVDLAVATPEDIDAIHKAWIDHQVLRFRGQKLNDDALADFSANFGELEGAPIGFKGMKYKTDRPEVTVISNIKIDGEAIGGLGDGEASWHSDMTYIDMPPDASAVSSLEFPECGGDSWVLVWYLA